MLIPAMCKEKELSEIWLKTVYNPKYKFATALSGYRGLKIKLDDNDWNNIQLISYDETDNKIIGYFSANVSQPENIISDIFMINFDSDVSQTYVNDLKELFLRLFSQLAFLKINFSVAVGNPAEDQYDKFIKRYNGRVVGTYKNHYLIDGKRYDKKVYEIFKEDFIEKIKSHE